jgi:hypothetical protein
VLSLNSDQNAGQDAREAGKDGWISMFYGKTRDGWKANDIPDRWKVADGIDWAVPVAYSDRAVEVRNLGRPQQLQKHQTHNG